MVEKIIAPLVVPLITVVVFFATFVPVSYTHLDVYKRQVLDEATAMLDPIGREKVMRTVHRLNDDYGITVVQITHYMEEAATADRVVVMSAGRVVMEGTPKEVFRNVEELRALHLDVPQAAELCHALTAAGCPMADDIIDVEECAAALYELLTGKKAPGAAQEKAEEVSACPQS